MNVKQGDLAIIVKQSKAAPVAGRIVEVLFAAPRKSVTLPDGHDHVGVEKDLPYWVVEFQGEPVMCPVRYHGGIRMRGTRYVVAPDSALRPISGIPDTETTDTPVKIEEPA